MVSYIKQLKYINVERITERVKYLQNGYQELDMWGNSDNKIINIYYVGYIIL